MAWSTGIHQTNPFPLSVPVYLYPHLHTPQPTVGQRRTVMCEDGLTGRPMEVSLQKNDLRQLSGIFAISADSIQENC